MTFWEGMIPTCGLIGFYIGMRIYDYVDEYRMAKIIEEHTGQLKKRDMERKDGGEKTPSHFSNMKDFHINTFKPPSRIIKP